MSTPRADKRFGQHYLRDTTVVQRMVAAMELTPACTVVEIGPGPGVLTKALLDTGAQVVAVEIDARMLTGLAELTAEYPQKLTVHHMDALAVDLTTLAPAGSVLCGNLPYNVGTEIVLRGLWALPHWRELTVMLQLEVIDRLLAQPGGKSWGKLGVWADLLTVRQKICTVKPGAFIPPPKVTSAVCQLIPRAKPLCEFDKARLEQLLQAVFSQRRKMLRASLKGRITEAQWADLATVGIAPTQRPEELSACQLCQLATLFNQ